MNKIIHLLLFFFVLGDVEVVFSQERLNEFEIAPDGNCPFTIRPGDGEYGFVVINTTLSDLRFTIPTAPKRLVKADFNSEKQQWLLTIVPNDNNYKRYRIALNSDGFKQGEIEVLVKQKESQCFDVNPKYSSVLEKLARNCQPSKDSKPSRVSKCKPENFTFEASMRGGTTFGVALDFTVSYFLIGFGADVIVFNRELTSTTSLVNSGYTGNFTKTTTMVLTEFPCSVFIDVGIFLFPVTSVYYAEQL